MQLCEFRIHARGPETERQRLASWLRLLPQQACSDPHTPHAILLDAVLGDAPQAEETPRQTYFWTHLQNFISDQTDELLIVGELRDAPPLLLLQEMGRCFHSLTFDCFSVLEHERHEHWRVEPNSETCELIEEMVINVQSDECESHYLKKGEESCYRYGSQTDDRH